MGRIRRWRGRYDSEIGGVNISGLVALLVTVFITNQAQELADRKQAKIDTIPQWQTFEATAYTARCDGCTGITKSGYDVRNTVYTPEGLRVIAVDPAVIPLGSTVEIRLADGDIFTAKALDIGGAIKNMRIDILVDSYDKAIQFGRQDVELRIISEGG